MFENFMVIIAIVVVLWLVGFAVYLYTSRQQQDITTQIDDLKAMLDADGKDAKN
jgi:hypothetical protein